MFAPVGLIIFNFLDCEAKKGSFHQSIFLRLRGRKKLRAYGADKGGLTNQI
jgi:hypothetical protein